jgi:hypothetical protein
VLGFRDNIVVATHIIAHAGRMAPSAEKPLAAFVTAVSKAYLKSKDTRLSDTVAFCEAVGKPNFLAIADKLTVKEAVAVLSRVDPKNAGRAKAEPAWARMRLAAVLTGEEAPEAQEPKPAGRAPRQSKAKPRIQRSVLGETDAFSAKRRERAWAAE